MTRINLAPVEDLCDQHLFAEHRELTRIPNAVAQSKYTLKGQPAKYTVFTNDNPKGGKGHVKFFLNKLGWLKRRYDALHAELNRRGIQPTYKWSPDISQENFPDWWGEYTPPPESIALNQKRILEALPEKVRFLRQPITHDEFRNHLSSRNWPI